MRHLMIILVVALVAACTRIPSGSRDSANAPQAGGPVAGEQQAGGQTAEDSTTADGSRPAGTSDVPAGNSEVEEQAAEVGSAGAASADGSASTSGTPAGTTGKKVIAIVCTDTESDPWTGELVNTIGAELGFDPFNKRTTRGHLDIYGPFTGQLSGKQVSVSICCCGLTGVTTLDGQTAISKEARAWLDKQQAAVVWLDGDPIQLHLGRQISAKIPVVFTGVVLERELYYNADQMTTGVYERFGLPRVLGELWKLDPDAKRFALLSDNAPTSIGRVQQYLLVRKLIESEVSLIAMPPATSWDEIGAQLAEVDSQVDGIVFCGVGEANSAADFFARPCPAGLLSASSKPKVVLGPSRLDSTGITSLRLKPYVHAEAALVKVSRILAGGDPRGIPLDTPDEMSVYRTQR